MRENGADDNAVARINGKIGRQQGAIADDERRFLKMAKTIKKLAYRFRSWHDPGASCGLQRNSDGLFLMRNALVGSVVHGNRRITLPRRGIQAPPPLF